MTHLDDENFARTSFSWRLHDRTQNKTYLFSHRTPFDKMQMMDALEYERAYVKENLSKDDLEIPRYTRLATLETQQYLMDRSLPTVRSFPSIKKPSKRDKTKRKTFSDFHSSSKYISCLFS